MRGEGGRGGGEGEATGGGAGSWFVASLSLGQSNDSNLVALVSYLLSGLQSRDKEKRAF